MLISFNEGMYIMVIYLCCLVGGQFAALQAYHISSIDISAESKANPEIYNKEATEEEDEKPIVGGDNAKPDFAAIIVKLESVGKKISDGANAFLYSEYKILGVFVIIFSILVYGVVDIVGASKATGNKYYPYATVSFIIGSGTSVLCGFLGMKIAVMANYRTTFKAMNVDKSKAYSEAFDTAYRAGCVMGFGLVSISLAVLVTLMVVYIYIYEPNTAEGGSKTFSVLMDLIAGYGLGGSAMALFGRVGGGIYTKAADVGADLAGKLERGLKEDDPRNPATIADNVGDNVGDIAGMGSDLFGSLAESTCAALVLISSNTSLFTENKMEVLFYPLMISALGIITSLITVQFAFYVYKVTERERIMKCLNQQLMISTIFELVAVWILSYYNLPHTFSQDSVNVVGALYKESHWWSPAICVTVGLISGFFIGLSTDYYTSNAHSPVQEMALQCNTGAAINVIYGLAVGYLSTIIPIFLLAFTIITCVSLLGMLGVALAAIGMLSTLSVGLAIDSYGPISDNAGGIAELAGCPEEVREVTDALDAAGNTTAAVGKGFAIGSAALVSLSLYGAFVTRARQATHNKLGAVEVLDGWVFGSMLIGAMLPYWFSALTMKSVGEAAAEMVKEVIRQLDANEFDSNKCIKISTKASLHKMIAPGLLVMLTPIIGGVLFGTKIVAGILPGALLSGIQLAISMSNTGGAWDNTKKYIEAGQLKVDGVVVPKKGPAHDAAVIGDTIGDPLKDTSGPSLNILVKLMAIISLVFANGFSESSQLAPYLGINAN